MSIRSIALIAISASLAACSSPQLSSRPLQQQQTPQLRQLNQNSDHQIVNIRWQDMRQFQELTTSGLDILDSDINKKSLEARISMVELQRLQQQGVRVETLPFQAAAAQDRQGFPEGYMTYTQMSARLKEMAQKYPQLMKLEDVGDTWQKKQGAQNHDIWMAQLGSRLNQSQPVYLLIGGVHARELAPVELLMKLMQELLDGYGKDPRITRLLDTRKVVFVPMVNVDGHVSVEQGAAWQRKNMNGSGVDLNRNYDNHWNYQGLKVPSSWLNGVTDPGSQIYSGSGPASEPETQVVQAMFQRFKPALAVDMHAYGDMMLWPLGYSYDDLKDTPVFKDLFNRTVAQLGFKGGTSAQILYPTTATTRDYAYEQHGAISMTLEVGDSFRPSYQEVEGMWTRLRPHLYTILETPGLK